MKSPPKTTGSRRLSYYGDSGDYSDKEKEIMAEFRIRKQTPLKASTSRSSSKGKPPSSSSLGANLFLDEKSSLELQRLFQAKERLEVLIAEAATVTTQQGSKIEDLQAQIVRQQILVRKRKEEADGKRLQKQIQTLENRLHQSTVCYDSLLAKNAAFRMEIESLQKQKSAFDAIFSRLQKEMQRHKREMERATEEATQAREQRVEALAGATATREQCCKDIAQFNAEFRELQRIYGHEMKLKAFISMKLTDRSEFEEQARKEEALKEEGRRARRKGKGFESFESLEVAYLRLLKLTANGDLERLATEFAEKEMRNFAAFSFVTELNGENERKLKSIQSIQNEIDHLKREQEKDQEAQYGALKEIEERLLVATEEGNRLEGKAKQSGRSLAQLEAAIGSLFHQMGCDPAPIRDRLGEEGEDVTARNLMQHFALIEKKANELLLREAFVRFKEAEAAELEEAGPELNPFLGGSALLPAGAPPPLGPLPQGEAMPFGAGGGDSALVAENADAPLNHENLRSLIQESLEKEKRFARREESLKKHSFLKEKERGNE